MNKKFDPEKCGMMVCPVCVGHGRIRNPYDVKVCQNCGGFGYIRKEGKTFDQKGKPISTPFQADSEISLQELKAQMEKLGNRIGGFKILIVEDSTLFRQLLKETLRERFPSIEILEAVNGEEAFQEIETSRPDLIFMDIRFPGENGIELTKKIKARYPNIIVIILTGYDLPEYQEFARQYADYFFSKDSSTTENIFVLVQSILQAPA